ncbi:Hypothetical predicted protein [Olea europaea subsp. europaea]|uniref:Uncharacterized protein n=1 Tax=Olea europaea subsp. europaea TaxID=158383 RepID=A0A8S0T9A9_OLEEU|nr:Hypothetical predicted protein [Olea europaea subsp. europaea]
MTGIKAPVRKVGSFFEPFIFKGNDQVTENGKLDLALSSLLTKFELLKTKINEHCIAVSKMPGDMAPKTTVNLPFIVDSVLDDLMYMMNNKFDNVIGVEDQIVTLHKELMSLGSSVTDIAVQHEAEHVELLIQKRHIAYEVEYVINSLPHVWWQSTKYPIFGNTVVGFEKVANEIVEQLVRGPD